jgi:hypothetical protein
MLNIRMAGQLGATWFPKQRQPSQIGTGEAFETEDIAFPSLPICVNCG